MKRTQKILGIVSLVLLMLGTLVTTVSAATVGDPYTIGGYHIGYTFIGLAILIGVCALVVFAIAKKGKALKFGAPVAVVAIAFMLIGAFSFTDVAAPAAEITTVVWSVSSTVDQGNVTTDDDARTITILTYVNATTETMNNTYDTATEYTTPVINFTIAPSQTVGLTDTTLGATTQGIVNNPDQEFTEDSTTYDLFQDASGEAKKDLEWTADGTTEYETHYCTVSFGSSETVLLNITFLDDGISQCDAGDSETFTLSIGGIQYTATIIVTKELPLS